MPTERRHQDSVRPPDSQSAPPEQTRPDQDLHPASSAWTWPAVTLTCVLALAALVFAAVLAFSGTDPRMAAGIALALIVGIVICVLPSPSRGSFMQRLADALVVLLGGKRGDQ
ncbi:hypothetical protein [Nocardia vulneris]|uniref:Uncharacterized protein n=1 Tax=Nocardia vulneris TaxID=1141657 RepID=A0ABR4Z508_9NOCA|nr:hypothetical protein [Nocardia vulneris]KIA60382.1 hypothetical protein FG87_37205 [Nocardia vulneris]